MLNAPEIHRDLVSGYKELSQASTNGHTYPWSNSLDCCTNRAELESAIHFVASAVNVNVGPIQTLSDDDLHSYQLNLSAYLETIQKGRPDELSFLVTYMQVCPDYATEKELTRCVFKYLRKSTGIPALRSRLLSIYDFSDNQLDTLVQQIESVRQFREVRKRKSIFYRFFG